MSFLRKAEVDSTQSPSGAILDPEFSKSYPALHEYLTADQYPDSTPRARSTVSIFVEEGLWKACLNERDQGLVLFVAEERFGALVEALELLLQEDRVPWRKSKAKSPYGAKSKSKGT